MRHKLFLLTAVVLPLLLLFTAVSQGNQEPPPPLFQYLSPRPNATLVSAETTIAFRPHPIAIPEGSPNLFEVVSITATGSQSGEHSGKLILAGDMETIILQPEQPFAASERVDVSITAASTERPFSFQYTFYISPPPPIVDDAERWPELFPESAVTQPTAADPLPLYRTVPYDFPTLDIYTAPGQGDGYVFLSHFNYSNVGNGKAYLMMFDENGEPVYYNRLYPVQVAFDFKKQPNGLLTYFDVVQKRFLAMDQSYTIVDSYQTGNGYTTDLHDMQLLDNNHALLLSYDYQIIDMSILVPGGHPTALVIGCIIQEIDGQGNVVFQWRSWDHISILDSNQDLTEQTIRYIHCNSVARDFDGHILLSSRHLDEVTKINRQTGNIIWRLGGVQNQFTFTNDPGFFYQHDARRLPNGRLSVYDNRTYQQPEYSRGVEYILDEVNLTATRIFEYRNTPDTFGGAMGNYQRLPGGNALVGWGWSNIPVLTEALADGTKVFELSAEDRFGTYRAFRFPWDGNPTWPPQLIGYAEGQTVNLYFSYNGATEITAYRIYGDTNDPPTTLLGEVNRDGYETTYTYVTPGEGLYYFRVMPITAGGAETQYANTLALFIGAEPVYFPVFVR